MRTSYTVTLPEEPPAAPFPALAKELRPRSPLSPSLLLSTFVGLLLNKAKVRGALFRDPHAEGWGSASLPGCPTPAPFHRAPARGTDSSQPPPLLSQGLPTRNAPSPGDLTLTRGPIPLAEVPAPPPRVPLPPPSPRPQHQVALGLVIPGTYQDRCRKA